MKSPLVVVAAILFAAVFLLAGCLPPGQQGTDRLPDNRQPSDSQPRDVLVVDASGQGDEPSVGQSPGAPPPPYPSDATRVSPYADSCLDLDGGMFPTAYGTTYRYYKGTVTMYEDSCTGDVLVEHYCASNYVRTREFTCVDGCSNGACLGGFATGEMQPVPEVTPEEPKAGAEDPTRQFYNCHNGFRDTEETDIDCGGPNCPGCGFGKRCNENDDCSDSLACNIRMRKCSDFQH